jgi:hypothetical protein
MQILKNAKFIAFANLKVVIFPETLEFKKTIACSYGQQQSMALKGHVSNP